MVEKSNNYNYTERLIQHIKDAGQELIDRAEEMVNKDTDMISDFNIYIRFDQEFNSVPEIEWTTNVICKNTIDRYL